MLLTLNDVLSSEVALRLCSILHESNAAVGDDVAAIVTDALWSHPLFLLATQPRSLSQPAFHRYDEGMESDGAVGDVMIGGSGGIRADVGVIVFLSDQSSYDGGELIVDSGYGDEPIKGQSGDCVLYPASVSHGVARVTHGTRWTAELWVQSLVRTPAQREILYDIGCSLHLVELFGGAKRPEAARLQKCHRNLLRMWAKP
jgi:PKHD-type hydroxylase